MGVIYKTTNLINEKWYIGKDQKNNPKYLGSGKLINFAIKKYGRENFRKEIVAFEDDRQILADLEREIIRHTDAVNDPMSYNIAIGGNGGHNWGNYPEEQQAIIKLKMKKTDADKESRRIFSINNNLSKHLIEGRTAGRKAWWASLSDAERSEYQRLRSSRTYKLSHNDGREIITDNLQRTAKEINVTYNYILLCIKNNKLSKGWKFEIMETK